MQPQVKNKIQHAQRNKDKNITGFSSGKKKKRLEDNKTLKRPMKKQIK